VDTLFLQILQAAASAGASDIHLKTGAPILLRVARQLLPIEAPLPDEAWMRGVLAHITPPHLATQGAHWHELDFAFELPPIGRFRANAFQQRGRSALVLRIVRSQIRSLEELRLPPQLAHLCEAPRGILLVCGSVGSGKSTTLAAMIEHLNQRSRKHIITIEDPIEFLFEDRHSTIEQREVGIDTESFASGLRHILRQDPDVLVIGEIRDATSAAAAMEAANTGHLVLSTLHSSDSTRCVQRVLDLFPAAERLNARKQLSQTLHAIACQRLVPSAHSGVLPVVELLVNSPGIAKLIANDQAEKIPGELDLGAAEGMQSFDSALQSMVRNNLLTQDEALAHASSPESLRMLFRGVVLNDSKRILSSR